MKSGIAAMAAWVALAACAAPASAGRRAFIWTWDTETLAKGDLELEQWLWAKNRYKAKAPLSPGGGWLWLSPVYGLYDRVELALPWELVGSPSGTRLTNFTCELRVPLYDRNREKHFVRTLVRVFGQWNFAHPDNDPLPRQVPWAGGNLVVSLGDVRGSHGTVDVGAYGDTEGRLCKLAYQTLGFGYTHRVGPEWRVGAEYFHEYWRGRGCSGGYSSPTRESHVFVGPTVAFSRGRVWATLGVLYGAARDESTRKMDNASRIVMPRFIFSSIL